tara:strand:- start:220 stop:540 length:321 start_codon:yes stop_codon:yes gene_type:complete
MNTPQIHLFVQEGCRPCHYVKTQLSKVDGWKDVITITDSKCCGDWTDFAKDSGVVATPTLVAFEDGEVVARQAGSQSFTSDFFEGIVDKFTAQKTTTPTKQCSETY